jgi:hypothetical protein
MLGYGNFSSFSASETDLSSFSSNSALRPIKLNID